MTCLPQFFFPLLPMRAPGGHATTTSGVRRVSFHWVPPPFRSQWKPVYPHLMLIAGSCLVVFTCVGISQPFLLDVNCSFRTRASSVPPRQRRLPSSWTPPSPRAAAASGTVPRRITATPTCSSRCTSTSTAWRRAAKAEVSCPLALCLLQVCLETGPSNDVL